jgi:FxsC-like protein
MKPKEGRMSSGQGLVPQTLPCYFFLSYARTPKRHPDDPLDLDRWVYCLYRDLCAEVAHLTGVTPADAGFMDREVHPSAEWPPSVAHSLATAQVFVPLYSHRYFESEECGREWSAFARRQASRGASGERGLSAIVPALWLAIDPSRMPEAARTVNFDHQQIGSVYSKEGFYGIIKLARYRREYELAVHRLAERIVEVANRLGIERSDPPDYRSSRNAFGPGSTPQPGGRRLHLMVAAHDTRSLPNGRGPFYYGPTPRDWNPYRPRCREPLADYAVALTKRLGYRPTVSTFEERAPNLAANKQPASPGLVLVDPWTAATEDRRARLRRFDDASQPWVSVLVPMNEEDEETASAEPVLRPQLRQALIQMLGRIPPPPDECHAARDGIPTLEAFDDILPRMARAMSRRYLKTATPYPPSGPHSKKPLL